jgi:hypothetical protein
MKWQATSPTFSPLTQLGFLALVLGLMIVSAPQTLGLFGAASISAGICVAHRLSRRKSQFESITAVRCDVAAVVFSRLTRPLPVAELSAACFLLGLAVGLFIANR